MARARNIKPGFFKNEDLAECTPWARLCFAGLWVLADREGRLEDRPKRIKGELFAYDSVEVDPLLCELEERGFLVRYRNQDGSFIQISKFSTHQTPHYSEKPSVIKPPGFQESLPDDAGSNPRGLPENSGKDGRTKRGSQPPDSLIPDSPKKTSEPSGSGATAPPTDRDVVFAAGVAMLTAAGVTDKNARSFLAMQCKAHGEATVRAALDRAAEERPIEPIGWLQATLKAKPAGPVKSKFTADREAQVGRWLGTATLPGIGGDVIDAEEAAHGAAPAIR